MALPVRKLALGMLLVIGFCAGAHAVGRAAKVGPVTSATRNPLADSPDAIAAGARLYGTNCSGCHGRDLTGGIGPDLTDQVWVHGGKPGDIYLTIGNGTPNGMPRWNDRLTPAEIWRLVSYIRSKAAR
jgi:cbb3-type cytochrome c oxidase subunit III